MSPPRYHYLLSGLSITALLIAAGIFWHSSEQHYIAVTNLGQRLELLQASVRDNDNSDQTEVLTHEAYWLPMTTAMQFEASAALSDIRGIHLSQAMHEQLSRFANSRLESAAHMRSALAQLNFATNTMKPEAPVVFNQGKQVHSSLIIANFKKEVSGVLSNNAAYSEWLSPILRQQHAQDRAVICKTQSEIDAFRSFTDRLQNRCTSARNKWAACRDKNETVIRHMNELRSSLEISLAKFKSRWPFKTVEKLCSAS